MSKNNSNISLTDQVVQSSNNCNPTAEYDIKICQAIALHVGGASNLRKIVENVTGQKVVVR